MSAKLGWYQSNFNKPCIVMDSGLRFFIGFERTVKSFSASLFSQRFNLWASREKPCESSTQVS